jgi:hypothetical protein
MRAALLSLALLAAAPAGALEVPSGQPVALQEVLVEELGEETWLRFRFIAPDISRAGADIGYEAAAGDMIHLCEMLALPYMAEYALKGDVIVVSLADRAVEFGVPDPEATQFFEAFRPVDNSCIWEHL